MSSREQIQLQEELERSGEFDKNIMPYSVENAIRMDEEYEFLCTRFYEKVLKFILYVLLCILWRPILFFAAGFRVRGKKNRKGVKGAISVSNHIYPLDAVMVHALSPLPWNVYHTGAYFNMKNDIRGPLLKWLGLLPISNCFGAQKNFRQTVKDRVEHGKIVHFYPEQALWLRYEKVRPFKVGAFKYAAMFSAPVLPAFFSFEDTAFRRFFHLKKRIVLNILPPVYPDKEKSERENTEYLLSECRREMIEAYERIYGKKMEFSTIEQTKE